MNPTPQPILVQLQRDVESARNTVKELRKQLLSAAQEAQTSILWDKEVQEMFETWNQDLRIATTHLGRVYDGLGVVVEYLPLEEAKEEKP